MTTTNDIIQLYSRNTPSSNNFDWLQTQKACLLGIQNGWLRLIFSVFQDQVINVTDNFYFLVIDEFGKQYQLCSAEDTEDLVYNRSRIGVFQLFVSRNNYRYSITSTIQLLNVIKPYIHRATKESFTDENWRKYVAEFVQGTRNEALSNIDRHRLFVFLKVQAINGESFFDYVNRCFSNYEAHLLFNRLGSYRGHYTNSTAKTKMGLTDKEVLSYSPEFGNTIDLCVAAVNRKIVRLYQATENESIEGLLKQHYPELHRSWREAIKDLEVDESYVLFFIHPSNLKFLRQHFSSLFSRNQVIVLDLIYPTKATISFRSMLPAQNTAPLIKLPVPIQATSQRRHIKPANLEQGPRFGKALADIFDAEDYRIQATADLLGVILDSEACGYKRQDERDFAYILRTNPIKQVKKNDVCIPVATLLVDSPTTGHPLFIEIVMKRCGLDKDKIIEYFSSYIETVLVSQFDVLLHYGIGLEGHQQNLNAVFDQEGRMKYFLYHDIVGGTEVYLPAFKKAYTIDPDVADQLPHAEMILAPALNRFIASTFWGHIFPIISQISYSLGIDKLLLYRIVNTLAQKRIELARARFKGHEEALFFHGMINEISETVLGKTLTCKCFMLMRVEQTPVKTFAEPANPVNQLSHSKMLVRRPYKVVGEKSYRDADNKLVAGLANKSATHADTNDILASQQRYIELVFSIYPFISEQNALHINVLHYAWFAAQQNSMLRLVTSSVQEGYVDYNECQLEIRNSSCSVTNPEYPELLALAHHVESTKPIRVKMVEGGKEVNVANPFQFLNHIECRVHEKLDLTKNEKAWTKLMSVFRHSLVNESLAMFDRWFFLNAIQRAMGDQPFISYLVKNKVRSFLVLSRLASYRGRLVMPLSKMKYPLDELDAALTSPEFGRNKSVFIIAVKNDLVQFDSQESLDLRTMFSTNFAEVIEEWKRALLAIRLDPDDYTPFPIHSMTITHIQSSLLKEIEEGNIVLFPVSMEQYPLLSYRSFISPDSKYSMKLPIPMQSTGSTRQIIIKDVGAYVKTNKALGHLIKTLPLPQNVTPWQVVDTLLVAKIGVRNQPDDGFRTVVVRQNICDYVSEKSELFVTPLAACFAISPASQKPLFVDILRLKSRSRDELIAYFQRYLKQILSTLISSLVNYGIALEAHQQNLNLVFNAKNGELESCIIFQDVEGLRAYKGPSIREVNSTPLRTVFEGTNKLSQTTEQSFNLFINTTMSDHILPLCLIIHSEFDVPLKDLNIIVFEVIENIFDFNRKMICGSVSPNKHIMQHNLSVFETVFKDQLTDTKFMPTKRLFGMLLRQIHQPGWGQYPPPPKSIRSNSVKTDNPFRYGGLIRTTGFYKNLQQNRDREEHTASNEFNCYQESLLAKL